MEDGIYFFSTRTHGVTGCAADLTPTYSMELLYVIDVCRFLFCIHMYYSRLPPNRYPIYPILPQIRCDFGFPGLVCGKIKNIPDTRYPIPVSRKKPIGITILGNIVLYNRDCWACMKPMFFSYLRLSDNFLMPYLLVLSPSTLLHILRSSWSPHRSLSVPRSPGIQQVFLSWLAQILDRC